MSRTKLKYGGKRRKAFLGADGAVMAAATLAAAGMTTAATITSANSQAKAMEAAAKTQAQSIKDQTANNNNLQKESLNFTRQQNQENRQQQQDIQLTLQQLAGQSNMNDRMEANKIQVKYGGKPKRRKLKSQPSYGGGDRPFKVTDGGDAIPLQTDNNGYGLYELYGNDHEHYHKAPGGKNKTGVGIKFEDGSVVEGEGNQNSNQGELMYVTPDDAVFISKHNIAGYNPAEAVKSGVHPVEAFNMQETLKDINGLNDDGSRKRKRLGGFDVLMDAANITQLPSNNNAGVAGGTAYIVNNSSPVAKCGKRVSLKRNKASVGTSLFKLRDNIRSGKLNTNDTSKGSGTPYGGAIMSGTGNLLGAGITTIGNMIAGHKLANAYTQAGDILADAYSQMHGIDLSEIKRENYDAPHTLAVIRDPNTNINPQLERIRRNSEAERREINRGTLSSAARQQRLAGVNDRMMQRLGEQYAYKQNADEQIKQGNAQRITEVAQANADRDIQARRDFANTYLEALKYNNDIENTKIAGIGQARADALNQATSARMTALQSSLGSIGGALTTSAGGFASTYDGIRKTDADRTNLLIGADTDNVVNYLIQNPNVYGNRNRALNQYNAWKNSQNEILQRYAEQLRKVYGFSLI